MSDRWTEQRHAVHDHHRWRRARSLLSIPVRVLISISTRSSDDHHDRSGWNFSNDLADLEGFSLSMMDNPAIHHALLSFNDWIPFHSSMRIFAFEWVRVPLSFFFLLLFMRFFLSVRFSYRRWRQILDEFRFRSCVCVCVCVCSQWVSSITLAHTIWVSFFSFSFHRIELL